MRPNPTYPAEGVCPPEELPDDLVRVLSPEGELLADPGLDNETIRDPGAGCANGGEMEEGGSISGMCTEWC